MINSDKKFVLCVVQFLVILFLGGYLAVYGNWKIETNLLSLLPKSSKVQNFSLAERALFADKEQQLLVLISGKNAVTATEFLHKATANIEHVQLLKHQEPSLTQLVEFYLPYKDNFLSAEYVENIENPQGLSRLVNEQLVALSNPFVSETLIHAPKLNLAHYLQSAFSQINLISIYQGFPSVEYNEKRYLLTRLSTSFDGFSLKRSQQVSSQLQQIFTTIKNQYTVEIHYSGILFHTAESTAQAKEEISLFGVASMIGVLLLIIFTFRSILPVIFASVTILIAIFYGVTGLLLFFDELHLLTLVFAVTLIGIVIDYCFHSFVYGGEHSLPEQRNDKDETQNKVNLVKPLCLGFFTTVLGYFSFVFSPLALLSQVAVFMIFGLFGALMCVLFFFPKLSALSRIKLSSASIKFSKKGLEIIHIFHAKRRYVFLLPFIAIFLLYFKQSIVFNDDVRLLNSSPSWLLKNEKMAGLVLGYNDSTRMIVIGDSVQKALENQEALLDKINELEHPDDIKHVSKLLPSIKKQREHFEQLKIADEQGYFSNALALTGLTDSLSTFTPLTLPTFKNGPLFTLSDLYISGYEMGTSKGEVNAKIATWIEFNGKKISPQLANWINNNPNVAIYDRANDVTQVLSKYRYGLLWLLCLSFLVVSIILVVKYGVYSGAISTLATIFSALIALTCSQLITGYLNIFNLLGVLLILALAIDYVIFYQEHGHQSRTFIAISLSALSSVLVFGMLMFSKTPAVNSFGLTVMIGIISIYLFAPLTCCKKVVK